MDDRLLEELERKRTFLRSIIIEMTTFLKNAPIGHLKCMKKGKSFQYYWITEKGNDNGKYISMKDLSFAGLLAQKSYDQTILKQAQIELAKIDRLIAQLRSHDLSMVYAQSSEARRNLISPIYLPDDEYVRKWKSVDYPKKEFRENDPAYYTANEERVRSKTEILIANMMHQKSIPYQYEFPINLYRMGTVYCDFRGLNVRKRKTMYHEHFGMMDDPEYCDRALRKINAYHNSGYILGNNFIATFESRNQPLDMRALERLLDFYYL